MLSACLASELTLLRQKVLLADAGSHHAFNLFYGLGIPRDYTTAEQLLTGDSKEIIVPAPLGGRILTFRLDAQVPGLLKSVGTGRSFQKLIREEARSDLLLINLDDDLECPPGRESLAGAALFPIFTHASEVLILVPSDRVGLRGVYGFLKRLFRLDLTLPVGVLFHQEEGSAPSEQNFKILERAVITFLKGKINWLGQILPSRTFYRALFRGHPMRSASRRDPNAVVLSRIAQGLAHTSPQPDSGSRVAHFSFFDRLACMETRQENPRPGYELSREEEAYFNRVG